MGLLDEALANSNLGTDLDNLTYKTAFSLDNLESKAAALRPQVTKRVVSAPVPQNAGWATEGIDNDQQSLDYLGAKIANNKKRSERFEGTIVSDENLTSDSWIVKGIANTANLGARTLSGLGRAVTGVADGFLTDGIVESDSQLPKDIYEIGERQRLAGKVPELEKDVQSLQNQIKYGGLSDADLEKANVALRNRTTELAMGKRPPTKEELARLDEVNPNNPLLGDKATWANYFKERNRTIEWRDKVRGNPAKGEGSLIGYENLGNDYDSRDYQVLKEINNTQDKGILDQVLTNAGDVVTSPGIVLDTIAQSLPSMIPQTRGLAVGGVFGENLGTSLDNLSQGGNQVSQGEQQLAVGVAAGAAGFEYASGRLMQSAGIGNLGGKVAQGAGSVASSVAKSVNSASKATIGKLGTAGKIAHGGGALLNNAIALATPLTTRIGAAATSEGVTELGQNAFEQTGKNVYRKEDGTISSTYDVNEFADSALLGAASGGYIATPNAVVRTGIDTFAKGVQAKNEERFGSAETSSEDLVNPQSSAFNPFQSLQRNIEPTFKLDPSAEGYAEAMGTAKVGADASMKAATDAVRGTQEIADRLDKVDDIKANVLKVQGMIDAVTADSSLTPEQRTSKINILSGMMDQGNKILTQVEKALEDRSGFEALHKKNQDMLSQTEQDYNKFMGMYDKNVPNATAVDPNASPAEVESSKILGAPNFGNVERMQALAVDESLPEITRERLRVVSDALIAENKSKSLGDVNKQVYAGTKGYRGMSQYITQMQKAVEGNDTTQQEVLTRQLGNFTRSLTSKLEAVKVAETEANRRYAEDPLGRPRDFSVQVARDTDGTWKAYTDTAIKRDKFNKNNGLLIHSTRNGKSTGSSQIIDALTANLESATATVSALNTLRNTDPNTQINTAPDFTDPMGFQDALDSMVADERENGRDTTARDMDPNAQVVDSTPELGMNDPTTITDVDLDNVDAFADTSYEQAANIRQQEYDNLVADYQEQNTDANDTGSARQDITKTNSEKNTTRETIEETVTEQEVDESTPMTKVEAVAAAKAVTKATGKKHTAKAVIGGYDVVEDTAKPKAKAVAETKQTTKEAKAKVTKTLDSEPTQYVEPETVEVSLENTTDKVDESPKGALSILDTNGLSYKDAIKADTTNNLVKRSFVQRLKDGSNSPLVTGKNLLSTLLDNVNVDGVFSKFISKNSDISNPTEAQVNLVRDFLNFNAKLDGQISATIKEKTNPEYHYESMVDYLLVSDANGNKVLDENTRTAIAVSAYDWLATNGSQVLSNHQDIANKIWMPEAKVLPDAAYTLLGDVGTYRNEVIKNMGQKAMAALQLRQLNEADMEITSKLTMALGSIALASLENSGLLQTTRISVKAIQDIKASIKEENPDENFNSPEPVVNKFESLAFVRPAVVMNGPNVVYSDFGTPTVHKTIKAIVDKTSEASTVLSSVFGFTPDYNMPSTKPITEVVTTFDDLGSNVSKLQKAVLAKNQSRPYSIDGGMFDVYTSLKNSPNAKQLMESIFGIKDPNKVLTLRADSVRSLNEDITRSLRNLEMTHFEFGNSDMYLENSVWSNMRSGITNVFNPQANRIHRAFSSLNSDIITVPHTETEVYKEGVITKYGMFLRGLGYRMEDAKNMTVNGELAKNYMADWLPAFNEYVNSETVQTGIKALVAIKQNKAKEVDYQTVADLISSWDNGADGLSVLNALADRDIGITNGSDFSSRIPVESDGSNNGPAFTQVLLNTGTTTVYNSVGVYFRDQAYETEAGQNIPMIDMVSYRKSGGKDMYEQLAAIKEAMMAQLTTAGNVVLDTINVLDTDFVGRKGAKRDLVPFNYGAGMTAVLHGASKAFYEGILDKYETAINNGDTQSINDLTTSVNILVKAYNAENNSRVPLVNAKAMSTLSGNLNLQEKALRGIEESVRGEVTKDALNEFLADYIRSRNEITQISNTAYSLFKPLYDQEMGLALSEYYAEFPQAAKIKSGLPKVRYDKVMKALRKYMPKVDVAMGIHNNEFGSTAIPLMSTAKVWSTKQLVIPFNRSNENRPVVRSYEGNTKFEPVKESGSIYAGIEQLTLDAPGASALAKYIQSHDAYVNFRVMEKFSVQNYHDASPVNPYEADTVASYQNEAFLDAVTTSHIGEAFVNSLLAPLQAYADGKVEPTKVNVDNLNKSINGLRTKFFGKDSTLSNVNTIRDIAQQLISNDVMKMNNLIDNAVSINQYATEGGHFTIDSKVKSTLNNRKKALIQRTTDKVIPRISTIFEGLSQPKEVRKQSLLTERKLRDEVVEASKEGENVKSPFERKLVEQRELLKDPKELIKMVQGEIREYVSRDDNVGKFAKIYSELLNVSKANLGNLSVNVFYDSEITDSNKPLGYDEALTARKGGVHAWYKAENGKRQINLRLGTTDKIDTKVVVHELIHAATADAIANITKERKGKVKASTYSKSANNAYDNLVANYDEVKAYIESNVDITVSPITQYGITNLDEFIATALTYRDFGDFLSKMHLQNKAPNARTQPKKGSMLRNVMENLLGLFKGVYGGGTPKSTEITALEALVIDVSTFIEKTTSNPTLQDGGSLLGAPSSNMDNVNAMSARDVLNALPSTGNEALDNNLDKVISSITDKVLSKLPKDYKGKNTFSPENIWNHALETGDTPYQSDAVKVGFKLSDREQFALEATEVAISETVKDKSITEAYAEIERMYEVAQNKFTPIDMHKGEWANATSEEKAVAEAKHNYLFGSGSKGLQRYIAMSLTTDEVGALSNFNLPSTKRNSSDNEYFERAYMYVDKVMDNLLDTSIGSNSRNNNTRMSALVKRFVDIDNKQRNKVLTALEITSGIVDDKMNSTIKGVANRIADVASSTSPESQAGIIARNLTITTLTGKPLAFVDLMQDFRNKSHTNETLGFAGELGKELGNVTSQQRTAEKLIMAQKQHENESQRFRVSLKTDLLSMFKDGGANLTKEVREAVTKVMLRTDVQALTDSYSLTDINELLKDRMALNKAIKVKRQGISTLHNYRAKILAWYMVSNVGHKLLAKNALAIASDIGFKVNNETDPKYVKQIDELVSLYALRYTDRNMLDTTAKIMDQEKSGKEFGGIENMLKFHKGLADGSMSALFEGSEFNYTKGYMPEITNGSKKLEIAETPADIARFRDAMYTEIGEVNQDVLDPSTFKPILFYTEDATNQSYLSGALPLYSSGAKGAKLTLDPFQVADIMDTVRAETIDENYDPRSSEHGSMIPLYDIDGRVVDMRYEMSSYRRDTLLERNNDFTDLLGAFAASGYTKIANQVQIENVVDALHEDYKKASTFDANKFVYVSYNSTDPVAYEAWNRLSNETKEKVKQVWGDYGMWVSNDAFLTVFGYTKKSLAVDAFDKEQSLRNFGEELYVTMMKGLFRGNARIVGARTEKMWQEMVALSKNFIVIRNVSTLAMNLTSNSFLLMAHGVPTSDILKHTRESLQGGMQYRKDIAMLTKLEARQRAGIGDNNELQNQIDRLRNRMDRNPMQAFIDKGMFAGIVEDIDPSQDMYSYQSGAQRKFDAVYNKVPKPLRTVAEYAFVTPSTPLYQFLHSATQYSDFSAKYVLYKHLKENKGKTDDEALFEAQDNFINYDVPTSPWLQYANDMGLVMFTKYNIRIQKALFKLLAQRPAAAIGQAIIMQGTTTLPYGIDPIVFNQYGNPFRDGAFGILDTWDQAFPIKAIF